VPRLLQIGSPGARGRLAGALQGHQLVWVETADEVRAALAGQRFDLIVVGAHFQESNSFEVLEFLAVARPAARIVCLRAVTPRRMLGKPAMRAFRAACEALGASLVLDLVDFPSDAAGNQAIRALLERELTLAA
jgi:hypothetical protein